MKNSHRKQHILHRYDVALEGILDQTMAMGQIVETQLADGLSALSEPDTQLAENVLRRDHLVNQTEVAIDTGEHVILAAKAKDVRHAKPTALA